MNDRNSTDLARDSVSFARNYYPRNDLYFTADIISVQLTETKYTDQLPVLEITREALSSAITRSPFSLLTIPNVYMPYRHNIHISPYKRIATPELS